MSDRRDIENRATTPSTEVAGPTSTSTGDERPDPRRVTGTVVAATTGQPLSGAIVTIGTASVLTGSDGLFELSAGIPDDSKMVVERSAWQPFELELPEHDTLDLDVQLEPLTVRGIRVSREVAADPARWRELLDLAEDSSVNTLVFDTKDEASTVLYESGVALANELGAVEVVYDPEKLLADAHERGLYTITRIVTFEDAVWANGDPEAKLAGSWVDAGNPANWRYPIDLAVEACQLGFDEIQFDYVRFPSGRTAELAADLVPQTGELRAMAIADFLAAARVELEAEGCGISAAIFGIVMSSDSDERLGQTPETISAVVDAVSPMLYPSHYSPGWLGFADPNDHPGPVIAFSLDEGGDRVDAGSAMRPWIQGFYYSGEQIKAQIEEAEARGAGWIIWNAAGNYRADWLPPSSASG
ncbi:MAG: putative glycoside hydrolase [Acidimicrobiales bacterium]